MGDLTKNFSQKEFRCRCGCGTDTIRIELVRQIQKLRELVHIAYGFEIPIHINSGIRCQDHNHKIGGAKNSYHLQGLAADISLYFKNYNRGLIWQIGRLIQIACRYGHICFGAVGVYPGNKIAEERIHVDIRQPGDDTFSWVYDNGQYTFGVEFAEIIKGGFIQ